MNILMASIFAAALYMSAVVGNTIYAKRNATIQALIATILWSLFYGLS